MLLVKFSRMPAILTRKESSVLGNTYSTVQTLDADVHVVRTKIPPQALLKRRLGKKEQPRSGQAWFALRKKDDLPRFTDHAHQANPYVEAWTDLGTFSLSIVGNLPLFSLLLSFTFSSDFVTVSWTRIHRSTAQPKYVFSIRERHSHYLYIPRNCKTRSDIPLFCSRRYEQIIYYLG